MLNISVSINNKLSKSLQAAPCRWHLLSGPSDWVSCCQQCNTTELTCNNPELLLQPVGDVLSSLRVAGTLVLSYLLVKPKGRKLMHRQWKQGRVTCEEQRDELYRDGLRKAKVKLEFGKAWKKNNTKGFYTYVNQKERSKKVVVFKVFFNPGHSTILWWSALQNKALKNQGVI